MRRNETLQRFLDAALAAYRARPCGPAANASLGRIAAALETPTAVRDDGGRRLPVCANLDDALAVDPGAEDLRTLLAAFRALEPDLRWVTRASHDASASANFPDGHANAMIAGPAGLENRADLWLGVSLLAPHVRYTDHSHAPEETYLVLSPGEFRQGEGDWFTPGIGGTFYNSPCIIHAMRSGDRPLLAFWALWVA